MRNLEPGASLLIPVKLNGLKTLAVVDTAAQVTVVSRRIWNQLRRPPPTPETVILHGAEVGSRMEAKLAKQVHLDIGGQVHRWDIHVAPIQDDLILGLDFLRAKGCTLDLQQDVVRVSGTEIPATVKRNADGELFQISRILVARKVVVPPNTEKRVMVRMSHHTKDVYAVSPEPDNHGLLMPNMIVDGADRIPVLLRNNTEHFISLRKGHPLGRAVEVDCELLPEVLSTMDESLTGSQDTSPVMDESSTGGAPTGEPLADLPSAGTTGTPSTLAADSGCPGICLRRVDVHLRGTTTQPEDSRSAEVTSQQEGPRPENDSANEQGDPPDGENKGPQMFRSTSKVCSRHPKNIWTNNRHGSWLSC